MTELRFREQLRRRRTIPWQKPAFEGRVLIVPEIPLGPLSNFPPGSLKRIEVPESEVALAVAVTLEGKLHIIDDLCTHAEARLSEGWLEEDCVVCPWHGSQFELETGRPLSLPATESVATYPPVIRENKLFVRLPEPPSSEGLDEAHLDG